MRIGELAKQAGVDVQTIRFYEREALIEAPLRTASSYRNYAPAHLERVRVKRAALEVLEIQLAALASQCASGHRVADCGILEDLIHDAHGEACACHLAGKPSGMA